MTTTNEDVNIAIVIGFATPLALAALNVSAITAYFVIAAKRRRKGLVLALSCAKQNSLIFCRRSGGQAASSLL